MCDVLEGVGVSGGRDRTRKATVVTETDPSEVWQWCRVSECGRESSGVQGDDG